MTLLYNLLMLAVDVAAVRLMRRREGAALWCVVMGLAGLVAFWLGAALAALFENSFGAMRLWTWGICLHGPLLLAATAALHRRTHPKVSAFALGGVALMALVTFDAFLIEPTWLDVTHHRIVSRKIHRPVRVVVVADFQTDRLGAYERSVLRRALAEKPDLILFAGDYVQSSWKRREALQREIRDFLCDIRLNAPLGMYAVRGNVDANDWPKMFEGTPVTVVTARRSFDLGPLRLTCLGLWDSFSPSLALADPSPGQFHLVLGHVPNYAMGNVDADLLVAGHTHGGQVCLPGLGAIFTVNCCVPFHLASGLNELSSGSKLFVSRGIGMERGRAPLVRFCCRPELAVLDLVPEK